MGCAFGKFSPPRKAERSKRDNGNVTRGSAAKPISQKSTRTHSSKHVGVGWKRRLIDRVSAQKISGGVSGGDVVGVAGGERERAVAREEKTQVENVSNKIARYEFVDGWPKWLVDIDNMPRNVFSTLVPSCEKLAKIGRGTYSNVCKARDKDTGKIVALKKIKCYMQQLLSGLQHCHERGVMHRDMKASNLVIDKRGVLKIADLGLANSFAIKPEGPLTSRVVTLWYRAPELLLGSTDYGFDIDLWNAGCLMAEKFVGRPIMPGRTEDYWRKMNLMKSYRQPHYKPNYEENFWDFPPSSLGLLTTLIDLDPAHRGSAASALRSEFFKSSPLVCDPSAVPVIYKDEDERSQTKRRKRHRVLKKEKVQDMSVSQERTKLPNNSGRDLELSKEEKNMEQNMKSQETGNSASSISSGSRLFMKEGSMNASISPVFLSSERKSPKTDGHPNALKNIKNYTLLQASMIDMINRNEGNEFAQLRRSFSALDFRLDPEKLSNLYGLTKRI